MSQNAYHWEARFRQRQVDKANAYRQQMAEKEAEEEQRRSELAAKQAHERRQQEESRKEALQEQIHSRDKTAIKKSYREREQQLQRLLQERRWHNDMINRMAEDERAQLSSDALRDHKSKSKVLRDHGLYRGDSSFFLDPEYS